MDNFFPKARYFALPETLNEKNNTTVSTDKDSRTNTKDRPVCVREIGGGGGGVRMRATPLPRRAVGRPIVTVRTNHR